MRLLYASVHSILEHDELKLFHELGHEVFSPGAYWQPSEENEDRMRPGLPQITYRQEWIDAYNKIGQQHPGQDGKYFLSRELVDQFDTIIIMHEPRMIEANWENIKHKRVIWRTIGQSVAGIESKLRSYRAQGMQIVRYSPREDFIPGNIGSDALIRFYKDPEEYKGWTGEEPYVINFTQHMQQRGSACGWDVFNRVTNGLPRKLFGPGNNQSGFGMGRVPHTQQLEALKKNRVYFYTGTQPASYTLNFIEAFMTGIPLVAVGPKYGDASIWRDHQLYEIHHLIKDGVNGFVSDNENILRRRIQMLLNDQGIAKVIGEAGRKEAIRHFGKDHIKASWKAFLER